jgi:hypothetical protein
MKKKYTITILSAISEISSILEARMLEATASVL